MSGLAALLAGHNPPDIYRWHNAAHVPDVQHAVEHAGWRFVYVDGWTVEDKATFLKTAAAAFDLPGTASESFDALSDALNDVTSGQHEGTVVLWDGWSPLARADEQAFHVALSVLGGRVNADRGDTFAVLLRGEGPPVDVPELPAAHH
ncbi:barstar family protein [Nocardioides sp. WL0053]|jgi:barstar (barnase inhibitor)|uniref:Barstar family protein n=1 Tax=Nocardioides jiangsuensis TaxID=2866161 RepID=A0ABS7RFB6_9ACTN|nr:barstar family protein [Nocardioides jiangsuensis]MBY9073729.1 barstar family protein [Nocardioides jiangsuensis]